MKKNAIGYFAKKWLGITILRIFEQTITWVDGNKEFYSAEHFSFVKVLEDNWREIRDEYMRINARINIPNIEDIFIEQSKISKNDSWRSFMLTFFGYDFIEHRRKCPVTASCTDKIPMMTSAMYSVLQPGKNITPHRGIYKGVMRCHLALIVPDEQKCEIIINGKTATWREGKCLIFDDTFIHSAHNRTDSPRVVLFIDFIRPLPQPLHSLNLFLFRLIARSEFIKEVLERSQKRDGVKFRERFPVLPEE